MADTTKRIYIGGKLMPPVKSLEPTFESIWSANTGRSGNGKMLGTLIARKYKLKVTFVPLSDEEAAQLGAALSSSGFFSVKFWSPVENKQLTKTMYAGTQTYPVYSYADGLPRYVGVGVDLIEQ